MCWFYSLNGHSTSSFPVSLKDVWFIVLRILLLAARVVVQDVSIKKGRKSPCMGPARRFITTSTKPGPKNLSNMKLAASILKKYGQPRSIDTEGGRELHLTFDYYCCYTDEEGIKIAQFLNSYSWKPHEVWFDRLECAIHGYNDAVSLVLMVDKKSQEDLTRWALKNEQDLEIRTGVHKHIPHTRLQNFHMTLGTVNQSYFPVQSAVEEINRVIPRGKWHKTPVILRRPVCYRCDKLLTSKSKID